MELANPGGERGQQLSSRLGQAQDLVFLLQGSVPVKKGTNAAEDLYAGGQALLDQGAGHGGRLFAVRAGDVNFHGIDRHRREV